MSENGEIYTAGKNFTLPPALTGWTNSTSVPRMERTKMKYHPELWTPAQILLDNFQEELSKCIEIGKSTCHSQTFRRMQNHRNSDVS